VSFSLQNAQLLERYRGVRAATERICAPLSAEDQTLQAMPDCSPTKWHRAHTTWFFETFILAPRGYAPFDEHFGFLFNSYYESLGPRHARPKRGMLSRPSAVQIGHYRSVVDERMTSFLSSLDERLEREVAPLIELGLAHEEQHQELILTDILNALAAHPFQPCYRTDVTSPVTEARPTSMRFHAYEGGLCELGASHAQSGFRFDNEEPRHRVWLDPFELSHRLVTVAEWKAFEAEGGYRQPSLWLSEGYDWIQSQGISAPLYSARGSEGALRVFGLDGLRIPSDAEPVAHVSYYEADAIARFLGARLPTEAEWEHAARAAALRSHSTESNSTERGNFMETGHLKPCPVAEGAEQDSPAQLFGDAWEWTSSSYAPYPGYTPSAGALGEYNGKFMVNQLVLRGGSCFTPKAHMRASYRNFWPAHTRFQMTGIRLARSLTS
jgi:ergothioneine biosynthesis protein EgtB